MTDKQYLITEAQRDQSLTALKEVDVILSNLNQPRHRGLEAAIAMLQSIPMVDSQPENDDVVELYGMKDGIQVHLGQAPTPPRMKEKEIVISVFGHFDEHDEMDDGDAALCFSCMTELINYMQKPSKPSPQALTPEDDGSDWFYRLQFICRVLEGKSPNKTDMQTALGMARTLKRERWMAEKSLTPITAEDVTDEMVLVWYKDFPYMATMPNAIQSAKKDLAAAYNAIIKNRIEA